MTPYVLSLRAGPKAREIIKKWEGLHDGDPTTANLNPYICRAGYWTIGWGHVVLGPNSQMLRGMPNKALAYSMYPAGVTMAECEALLRADLIRFENGVRPVCEGGPRPTSAAQFGAMVSLACNIGIGAFQKSSVARNHAMGNYQAAADSFMLWNKATVDGVRTILPGLTNRRAEERALYLSGT